MQSKSRNLTGMAIGLSLSLLNAGCGFLGIRTEETPTYSVFTSDGDKEVRQYGERIVAKTRTRGTFRESQNEAFRILANYIFGANESRQKIAMTAPVTSAPTSEKIAMTAPVTQAKENGEWVMTFTMPAKYTLETLPKPTDPRVQFETLPARKIAAIRYSGFWSEERNEEKARELQDWLNKEEKWRPSGAPRFAGYDPPWTLPFLRRNEMLIDLSDSTENK